MTVLLIVASQEKYFQNRVKVNGKVNNLGDKVQISRDKSKIVIVAELPFSKRYIKVSLIYYEGGRFCV